MNEILKFLKDAKTFFLATVDENKPKVRPFGFVMEYEGKLYFCTSSQKDVYKQLVTNPNFEACAMAENGQWIRLQGKAVFDSNLAAKAKVFEIMPSLARMYNTYDNPIFQVFYVEEGEATLYSFSEEPRVIKL